MSFSNRSGPTCGMPSTTITDSTPSVSVGLFLRKSPNNSEIQNIYLIYDDLYIKYTYTVIVNLKYKSANSKNFTRKKY